MINKDTILALATASGVGAIAVLRLSGPEAIAIADRVFRSIKPGKLLTNQKSHTIHLGHIVQGERILDEVLISLFKNPHSYTGEDVVEFSCHGSMYIQQELIKLLLAEGARMADAGEYTLRAFLNGKMDLSQAEAVADLIASDSASAHQIAMQQMRGGFSNELQELRQELLNFASLMELELDFAEEDVNFADRKEFQILIQRISDVLKRLIDSFALGNVLKNGIPVAIVGEPNVGKSTLLNALLNEDKAIVSDIAGTTRDSIEDELIIEGVAFRFVDTAGIRDTEDTVENIGIRKTFEKIDQSQVVLYLVDSRTASADQSQKIHLDIEKIKADYPNKQLILVINKIDQGNQSSLEPLFKDLDPIYISAKQKRGIEALKDALLLMVNRGQLSNNDTIVSNSRHFEALSKAFEAINQVKFGMDEELSTDLLAIDLRQALHYLGEITGEVSTDDLLGNIFANFCIGK
ncbi:tRNA uridine-5-carboxymethylaminomethyl(34) synthesis GTPase MnmE [Flavobacteriaceae bacterium]|nr:tRNA uridine-5-carboxymethylaminomethyl(34) synthesis GTPase MnmE [Flavobacteriaceae bacterium]